MKGWYKSELLTNGNCETVELKEKQGHVQETLRGMYGVRRYEMPTTEVPSYYPAYFFRIFPLL